METSITLSQSLAHEREYWSSTLDTPTVALINRTNHSLLESGIVGRALQEGETAPDFRLPNARGGHTQLDDLLRSGPVVLLFYRGQWCPYCNLQLRAYQQALPKIRALGATLLAISPQLPDHSLSTTEKNELGFDVLSDVGLHVARAYRLAFDLPSDLADLYKRQWGNDLVQWNGEGGWSLPIPATYIIDRYSAVMLAHVDPDYRNRLEPEAVLDCLRTLAGRQTA